MINTDNLIIENSIKNLSKNLIKNHLIKAEFISDHSFYYGEDSDGNDSVWINFAIRKIGKEEDTIKSINHLTNNLKRDLLHRGLTVWPYINFNNAII